jgi:hypothetical protein
MIMTRTMPPVPVIVAGRLKVNLVKPDRGSECSGEPLIPSVCLWPPPSPGTVPVTGSGSSHGPSHESAAPGPGPSEAPSLRVSNSLPSPLEPPA